MTSLLAGCHRDVPDPRLLAPLVRVALVGPVEQAERAFTGVITARVESELAFRVAGKVTARLVDNGQTVRRGQALMRIDVADLRLEMNASMAGVEAARARASQTASDELRYRHMVVQGSIAVLAYEQAKTAAAAAAAELRAAQASAKVASNATAYSVLFADANGVVVETRAEPGQVVAAGQTIIRLAHSGPREAMVDLPETVRPEIGSRASARTFGNDALIATGHLRQLAASANAVTRTYEARYVLDGSAAGAPLGSTVTINMPVANAVSTVQVPLSALTDVGHGPGVWIIQRRGDQLASVAWRPVKLGGLHTETASVVEGLRQGDRFVAMGAHMLHQGDRVRLAEVDARSDDTATGH